MAEVEGIAYTRTPEGNFAVTTPIGNALVERHDRHSGSPTGAWWHLRWDDGIRIRVFSSLPDAKRVVAKRVAKATGQKVPRKRWPWVLLACWLGSGLVPVAYYGVTGHKPAPARPPASPRVVSPGPFIPYAGNGLGPTRCADGTWSHSAGPGPCSHHG